MPSNRAEEYCLPVHVALHLLSHPRCSIEAHSSAHSKNAERLQLYSSTAKVVGHPAPDATRFGKTANVCTGTSLLETEAEQARTVIGMRGDPWRSVEAWLRAAKMRRLLFVAVQQCSDTLHPIHRGLVTKQMCVCVTTSFQREGGVLVVREALHRVVQLFVAFCVRTARFAARAP